MAGVSLLLAGYMFWRQYSVVGGLEGIVYAEGVRFAPFYLAALASAVAHTIECCVCLFDSQCNSVQVRSGYSLHLLTWWSQLPDNLLLEGQYFGYVWLGVRPFWCLSAEKLVASL